MNQIRMNIRSSELNKFVNQKQLEEEEDLSRENEVENERDNPTVISDV